MATPSTPDMQIAPQRAKQLLENLSTVTRQIQAANKMSRPIRLTAVSKLHPASAILALHQPPPSSSSSSTPTASPFPTPSPHPLTHFGENYAQELATKASVLPRTIKWHFIGALQSNKCKALAEIPNLWAVESVDTAKKADLLEKGRRELVERGPEGGRGEGKEGVRKGAQAPLPAEAEENDSEGEILRVFVQVNTSGEASKSGLEPGAPVLELCEHVRARCPHLKLQGLMTIGAIARSVESADEGAENEDFLCLRRERDRVQELLGGEALELSMGMSGDFEGAIRCGSDEVRVGSGIFGERPRREDAVV